MRLKRTGETRGKRLLYNRKKEMRKDILASLQVQNKNVIYRELSKDLPKSMHGHYSRLVYG